jgi:mxaA protein
LARQAVLLALLACPALSHAQALLANDIVEPRTFGYVVGDKIRREVRLSVRSGYRLDEAGLPKAGRIDRWLEVAAPEVRAEPTPDGLDYRLVLTYQVLNAPRAPATLTIPQQDLRLVGRTQAVTTLVPALRVTVAPVTSGIEADRLSGSSLQPDRAPAPLPVRAQQTRLAWTGTALAALLLLAAWRHGLGALDARRNLPFGKAVRELKKLRPGRAADPAMLKIVHDAVNTSAGQAVFAHNLDDFLSLHPEFAGLRDDLERLFATSGRVFFGGGAEAALPADTASALLKLCRLGSTIERRSQARRSRAFLAREAR